MQTTIVKWGNSQGVRLPKYILNRVHLSDRDAVEVYVEGDNIIIKKCNKDSKHKTIQELFAGFNDEYEPIEVNWGEPVGKEIW
ncbi:AbrB/MazE/SpoVT family DNA-binding domain-containing protein [uncultured Acetobacterium sp.]|uniref:AbrB/MazE/SpoVT family DNA-binding domain-containing protein n=1 Tax=uncultured Acetobacterium sp. TaxID=217139 RepID=UPI0025F1DC0A|nr:AbrB/MazE/SpoVT family DNA-binding domain-containing protein [uncultured Acetobacterium sp.]